MQAQADKINLLNYEPPMTCPTENLWCWNELKIQLAQ